MGLLRLLLALAVLLQHSGGIGGYAMIGGPLAVQGFFIISGFYMGLVLNERYDRPALNGLFFANRALRIYSLYFFFLAAHLAIFAAVELRGIGSPLSSYFDGAIPWREKLVLAVLNLSVLGQELPLFLTIGDGHIVWAPHQVPHGFEVVRFMVIPATWSLSLELWFYLLAPFVARRPAGQIAAVMAASLFARAIAAELGYTADPYSCRFFPFELALFLAGVLAYKAFAARPEAWSARGPRALAISVPVAVLAYPWLLGSWDPDAFFTPPRLGFLTLLAVAMPAIHAWSRNSARDARIGELSYPVYLGHLLVLGLIGMSATPGLRLAAAVLAALALAWLAVRLIERPTEVLRRRLASRAHGEPERVVTERPSSLRAAAFHPAGPKRRRLQRYTVQRHP